MLEPKHDNPVRWCHMILWSIKLTKKKINEKKKNGIKTLDSTLFENTTGYNESVTKYSTFTSERERVYLGGNRTQAVQAK